MKLVIAEKPSVAAEIAKVLGADKKENGYMIGNGYYVSWCVGHLVSVANPEDYNENLKKWSLEALPIIPDTFKYSITGATWSQYKILKGLMLSNDVDELICATDAGREGELIFRLVYSQTGCKKPFERLWISSMEAKSIKNGFDNLKPGKEYDKLYQAALCRLQADWLIGINLTRLYSCLYGQTLRVGRVQTPTVNLIVNRQKEIDSFTPQIYYIVKATLNSFIASKKITDKKQAEDIANMCQNKEAYITSVDKKDEKTNPPKLYDLTTLQREANRYYGLTAQQTLDVVQKLYEAKLTTYPRTDSQYITDDMVETTKNVVSILVTNKFYANYDFTKQNVAKLANNKKVSDHHAIIPTLEMTKEKYNSLSVNEQNVAGLIIYKLLSASYEPHLFTSTKIILDIEGASFTATGKEIIQSGFKDIEKELKKLIKPTDEETASELQTLPRCSEGNSFSVSSCSTEENQTQPPKAFTEDTLLTAMETAGKNIIEDDLKEAMKDRGLGTPATRANIIETIIKAGYIERKAKNLLPTAKAMTFIDLVVDNLKKPELTAQWELQLTLIEKGDVSSVEFICEIKKFLTAFVVDTKMFDNSNLTSIFQKEPNEIIGKCPICGNDVIETKTAFSCSKGKDVCKFYIWKTIADKTISKTQAMQLLENKKSNLIKGFKSKSGKTFDAFLVLNNGTISFEFDNSKK